MAGLFTYLAHLPAGQTAALCAIAPGVVMLAAGFALRHAMDVAAAKIRGR